MLLCNGLAHAARLAPDAAARMAQARCPESRDLLSIPNDAVSPKDIRKNVAWLETAFRKRGFVTQQLPNEGKPMLFAQLVTPKHSTRVVEVHAVTVCLDEFSGPASLSRHK